MGFVLKKHLKFVFHVPVTVTQIRSKPTDLAVFRKSFNLLKEAIKEKDLDGNLGKFLTWMNLDFKILSLFREGCVHTSCVTIGDKLLL